jgi:tetratricopeptide (TPR) repeat protein
MNEYPTDRMLCLHLAAVEQSGETAVSTTDLLDSLGLREGAVAGHFEVISGLSTLTDRGLVETRQVLVEGEGNTETVYELTEAGREHAGKIESQVADREVVVETGAGSERLPLGEAAGRLGVSLAEAVAGLRGDELVLEAGDSAIEPESTPFVGRERELAELDAALDRTRSGQQGLVRIEGEPGVGKTYLATEFEDRVAGRGVTVLSGQCVHETEVPYGPVLGATRDLPPAERDRVVSALTAGGDAELSDPDQLEQKRESLFAGVADELATLAGERPIVLVLDDAQWLDHPTALLVAHLASELAAEQFLAIALSYPEGGATSPLEAAVEADDLQVDRLRLGPFERGETGELVRQLVGTRRVPDSFVETLQAHTGGHPLFVTESVTRMIEEGAIRPAAGVYPERAEALPLPETVEAAITDRLATLDDGTLELLETASLIGTVVPERILVAASGLPEGSIRERIDLLVGSRLWDREDSGTVRFVSDAVRETIRDGIPADDRGQRHRRIATAYQETTDQSGEYAAVAASHYDRAGAAERAVEASLTAAEHATDVYAHEVAIEACERAVELAREIDDGRAVTEALELLGNTYETIGEYEEAKRCFRYVRGQTDSRETIQRMWNREGQIETKLGQFERARDCLEPALELHRELDDPEGRVETLNSLGIVAVKQTDFEAAREYFERGSELYRELGSPIGEAKTLGNLGVVERKLGNYGAAQESHRQALDIFREHGDKNAEANSLGNLGLVATRRGELSAARESYEECLDLKREVDSKRGEARVYDNLGTVERLAGNLDAAREYYQRAIGIDEETGDRHGRAQSVRDLGTVERMDGAYGTAREHYQRSLETLRDAGDRSREAEALGEFGMSGTTSLAATTATWRGVYRLTSSSPAPPDGIVTVP